jgi:hypothetical protein
MADTPQQAALRARYPDLDALHRGILQGTLPAATDWSDLPVYCRPELAPVDTFHVWSYSSARQICGADMRDIELRSDLQITVRGHGIADGWTARTEDGAVVLTAPDGTESTYVYDAQRLWIRRVATAYRNCPLRQLDCALATAILAHEADGRPNGMGV